MSNGAGTAAAERGPNVVSLSAELLRAGRVIPTAAQIAFLGEDLLIVDTVSPAAGEVVLTGRFLDAASGQILPLVRRAPIVGGITNVFVVPPGIGYLLQAHVLTSLTPPLNGAPPFVTLAIGRGSSAANTTLLSNIVAGYSGALNPLVEWPGQLVAHPNEGPGFPAWHTGTTPAVGTNVSETVPVLTEWRPQGFRCTLATSAAGGNRTVFLTVVAFSSSQLLRFPAWFAQAPSTTIEYHWFAGAFSPAAPLGSVFTAPLPPAFRLRTGDRITTVTSGLDVADQFSIVQYSNIEFVDDI